MDDATMAVSLARGRIAIGAALLLAPRLSARALGAARSPKGPTPMLARMVGGRDLALGLGTMVALDRAAPVRGWLEFSALADAIDCLASLVSRRELPARVVGPNAILGGASAIAGMILSRRLDPQPQTHGAEPETVAGG